MTDLSLEEYKARKLSRQELKCLLQKEAENLLGSDFLRRNRSEMEFRSQSQGLRSWIWFLKKEKKPFIFSRRGLRIFTLR
jgi:hypothetical protein